jgi:hypothetical protein
MHLDRRQVPGGDGPLTLTAARARRSILSPGPERSGGVAGVAIR